jgi:hypothetical protein
MRRAERALLAAWPVALVPAFLAAALAWPVTARALAVTLVALVFGALAVVLAPPGRR